MKNDSLRRYTSIPALVYLLTKRAITLLDPISWDDANDSHYLAAFKRRKNLQRVLVLCFSEAAETYHHWRVFAPGSSGVCIRFHRKRLLAAVRQSPGVTARLVRYLKLAEAKQAKPKLRDLPFLKRAAFEPEREFRFVFASKQAGPPTLEIPIHLSLIARVSLSPWIPIALADEVKALLRRIDGCASLDIVRSTLINNERWKKLSDGP